MPRKPAAKPKPKPRRRQKPGPKGPIATSFKPGQSGNPTGKGGFKPGQSGNPKGAPLGSRSLYTPARGMAVCEHVAAGMTFAAACEAEGISARLGVRWRFRHPEFREMYEQARLDRVDTWSEEMIDIADYRGGDYKLAMTDKNGKPLIDEEGNPTAKPILVKENVLRSKLRIETRQWNISRLNPQQWGDRQQIDLKADWVRLSEEERVRKAMRLLGMVREVVEREKRLQIEGPRPITYDPTDGDELAEQEQREKARRAREADEGGAIGR